MDFDIRKFDQYRENNRLEVKRAAAGLPDSLWSTYSSMANSSGGVILLGVAEKNDGSFMTTGMKNAEKLLKDFWNTINNRQKVSTNLLSDNDILTYEVGEDVILAIHVPRARREDKPVHINQDLFGGTFRRNGEGDYHCTKNEIKAMLRDQTEETSDMKMLDPTIRWTDRLQSGSGDWTGNLFDFFFRVYSRMTKDLKVPFRLEGITRIDDTPVHKALREALANCLVNTDFFVPRGIVIKKDADTIILENPGYIRTGKEQMLKGGISDPRNKALMKMFNLIGIGERAGSGVPDIYAVWDSQGWRKPIVKEEYTPDRTILILPFTEKQAEKTSRKNKQKNQAEKNKQKKQAEKAMSCRPALKTIKTRKAILAFLSDQESRKASEIAAQIGLSPARTRVLLAELSAEGRIRPEGNGRSRRYRIAFDSE